MTCNADAAATSANVMIEESLKLGTFVPFRSHPVWLQLFAAFRPIHLKKLARSSHPVCIHNSSAPLVYAKQTAGQSDELSFIRFMQVCTPRRMIMEVCKKRAVSTVTGC